MSFFQHWLLQVGQGSFLVLTWSSWVYKLLFMCADRMRWFQSITNSKDMNLSKLWEIVGDREAWCVADHEVAKSRDMT